MNGLTHLPIHSLTSPARRAEQEIFILSQIPSILFIQVHLWKEIYQYISIHPLLFQFLGCPENIKGIPRKSLIINNIYTIFNPKLSRFKYFSGWLPNYDLFSLFPPDQELLLVLNLVLDQLKMFLLHRSINYSCRCVLDMYWHFLKLFALYWILETS